MPSLFSQLKNRLRRNRKLLIGTIITPRGLRLLATGKDVADCAEVRIDHLLHAGLTVKQIAAALRRRKKPVLLTLRSQKEGGVYRWKKGERTALALLLLAQADAIDLEIDELAEMQIVMHAAQQLHKGIVLSAHNIKSPASALQLRRWIKIFRRHRALYYKIAGRINRPGDLRALAKILKTYPRHSWSLMGLGPQAAHSRAMLSSLGSCAAYGHLDQPAAPGQPAIEELALALNEAW
jgi:3-dehydroquinate dehydratase-1